MPPARRRPKPKPAPKTKPRARRAAPRRWPQLPMLEQRHFDLIGLGLVAAAVFLAFVVYLGWDGGQAGDGAVEGLRVLLGAVHYVVPAALMAAGAILVLRPVLPGRAAVQAGAICLFAALALGLAAGTLGLGPAARTVVVGRRVGQAARRRRGGGALLASPRRSLGDARRPHRRALPLRRRGAAAHRRLGRRRRQGHERLGRATTTREVAHRGPAPPPGRPRSCPRSSTARRRAPSRGRAHARPERRARRCPTCSATPRTSSRPPRTEPSPELPEPEEEPHLAEDPETDEPGVARTTPDRRGPHAAGPLPRRGHRRARLRVDASPTRASSSARAPRRASPTPPARRRSPPS